MTDIHSLRIYQNALSLIKEVYSLIQKNKILLNDFSLSDQIKRAAVSVACNISEGYLRSRKLSKSYLSIAAGSANEVVTQLEIIETVYNIETKNLQEKYIVLGKQINAFSSKF